MAENPNSIPENQIEYWRKITKAAHDNILGLCMFCQHPIFETEIKQGPVNFRFISQTLVVNLDDKVLKHDVNGFFCCGKCITEPAKVEVLKQIAVINIDLNKLNAKFAEQLRKHEIKEKYKENLQKELQEETPQEEGKEESGLEKAEQATESQRETTV